MKALAKWFMGILVGVVMIVAIFWLYIQYRSINGCGGFVGKICRDGYTCKYDNNYPDAQGTCIKNR